ncbi:MAG: F-type H+-transporting ATPase subunit b [Candidatus Omnitrophota bacterium]|jgi:F-type H+-transporting ATPase subunit b
MAENDHSHPEADDLTAHVEHAAGHDSHEVNPMEINTDMVLWTWVVFAALLILLYKVAWKPILGALDQREKDIQDTIDERETVREELASIETVRAETVAAADAKSAEVLDAARQGAQEQARHIEAKAREDAQIIQSNATRDIEAARANAEATLKRASGDWAVELASKIIGENMDNAKNRSLTDRLIEEL